jgi:hypothetical protein
MKKLAPPYDLVKIDVEGAEYDFLLPYNEILSSTNSLIIEWHSWHRGGRSVLEIQKIVQSYGFESQKSYSTTQELWIFISRQGGRFAVFTLILGRAPRKIRNHAKSFHETHVFVYPGLSSRDRSR